MKSAVVENLESRRLFDTTALLTAADVSTILAQAASQARSTQAIVVVGRDGNLLGEYDKSGLTVANPALDSEMIAEIRLDAALRAKTAASFESRGEAFTTRTARFIIQDHFPQPIQNTPGGPLYGVEFSSFIGSDILSIAQKGGVPLSSVATLVSPLGLSGDPGGIPLYKAINEQVGNTIRRVIEPVGAIGVAGDFRDIAPRQDLIIGKTLAPVDPNNSSAALKPIFEYAAAANPRSGYFNGKEAGDLDESVALAGAIGHMAPDSIRANHIFLDGLRAPFAASGPARSHHWQTLGALLASGDGSLVMTPIDDSANTYPTGSIGGVAGTWVRANERANPTPADQKTSTTQNYLSVASNDLLAGTTTALSDSQKLTVQDVTTIITNAVAEAASIRGGIREPIGSPAKVFVTVVDRDGDLLGAFRIADATTFSYDVAVQKARTAAFFSDDTHAFGTRVIGFISQRFMPPGINNGITGPMYELQDVLNPASVDSSGNIVNQSVANASLTSEPLLKSIGAVTASIADPTTGTISVDAVGATIAVGQIITFGDDTAHEYLVTATGSTGISVQLDGIDASSVAVQPLTPNEPIYPKNLLKNGITIFPGGVPLYKNGVMVGAIGVSGDGVDQDDIIAYTGTVGFRPIETIRSDELSKQEIPSFISTKLQALEQEFNFGTLLQPGGPFSDIATIAKDRLIAGLAHLRLPYVKFPRNPKL